MRKKYVICLSGTERAHLTRLAGDAAAPVLRRRQARLLLDADTSGAGDSLTDQAISLLRGVSAPTVARARQLCATQGVAAVLAWQAAAPPPLSSAQVTQISQLRALLASPPPPGTRRWSLRRLADAMVAQQHLPAISHETVRRLLRSCPPGPEPAGDDA